MHVAHVNTRIRHVDAVTAQVRERHHGTIQCDHFSRTQGTRAQQTHLKVNASRRISWLREFSSSGFKRAQTISIWSKNELFLCMIPKKGFQSVTRIKQRIPTCSNMSHKECCLYIPLRGNLIFKINFALFRQAYFLKVTESLGTKCTTQCSTVRSPRQTENLDGGKVESLFGLRRPKRALRQVCLY